MDWSRARLFLPAGTISCPTHIYLFPWESSLAFLHLSFSLSVLQSSARVMFSTSSCQCTNNVLSIEDRNCILLSHPFIFDHRPQVMAVGIYYIHLVECTRFSRANSIPACCYPRTTGCRIPPLECFLCPLHPRRCLFPMDDTGNPVDRRWCCPHRYIRYRARANSLAGRSPRIIQPTSIRCLLLYSWGTGLYLSGRCTSAYQLTRSIIDRPH